MLKSLLIALATVACTVLLILVDPVLLRGFKAIAPDAPVPLAIAAAMEYTLATPVVLVGIILYALALRAARWRRFWLLFAAAFTQSMMISQLKRVFSRMRPDDLVASFGFYGPMWEHAYKSFPGGHAAGSFCLAALFAHWHPRWRWAFYAGAILITLSRIYLQRHFVSDCFIGANLGYWVAQTFLFYFEPREKPAPVGGPAAYIEVAEGDEPA